MSLSWVPLLFSEEAQESNFWVGGTIFCQWLALWSQTSDSTLLASVSSFVNKGIYSYLIEGLLWQIAIVATSYKSLFLLLLYSSMLLEFSLLKLISCISDQVSCISDFLPLLLYIPKVPCSSHHTIHNSSLLLCYVHSFRSRITWHSSLSLDSLETSLSIVEKVSRSVPWLCTIVVHILCGYWPINLVFNLHIW